MQFLAPLVTLVACGGFVVNALRQIDIGRVNGFETCRSPAIWDYPQDEVTMLVVICKTEDGKEVESFISLGRCIANRGGNLVAASGGDFRPTCKDIGGHSTDTIMIANCKNDKGGWTSTEIELADVVYNKNGLVSCFDQIGDKWPFNQDHAA
ncbi:hypothetical protein GGR57DRAFT_499497 [Xylariaceae sp. FL1272]|nr:hypothetical protein GGR57DRAFT_499497 [Xylariaceae sp. FL1272]